MGAAKNRLGNSSWLVPGFRGLALLLALAVVVGVVADSVMAMPTPVVAPVAQQRHNFGPSGIPGSSFPGSNFPGSRLPSSSFPGSNFPSTDFPSSSFPSSNLPSSSFPSSQTPSFPDLNKTPFPGNESVFQRSHQSPVYSYYCTNCNAQVSKNATKCRSCGVRLVGFTNEAPGSGSGISSVDRDVAMGFVVILVGGLIGLSLLVGIVALIVKAVSGTKKRPNYVSSWNSSAGVNPTLVPTNQGGGMYQKEAQKRWGLAQVPKSISGAPDARTGNLGYAQGVARRPTYQPPTPQPQPGQYQQRPQNQYPQANRPGNAGGAPMGRPAGYPPGQVPPGPGGQRPVYGTPAGHPGQQHPRQGQLGQRPGGPPPGPGRR